MGIHTRAPNSISIKVSSRDATTARTPESIAIPREQVRNRCRHCPEVLSRRNPLRNHARRFRNSKKMVQGKSQDADAE